MTRCPQSYSSTRPPRAAVRQSRILPQGLLLRRRKVRLPTPSKSRSRVRRKTSASSSRWSFIVLAEWSGPYLDQVERVQQFQGAGSGAHRRVGDMQIPRCRFQSRRHVRAKPESCGGRSRPPVGAWREGMPQGMRVDGLDMAVALQRSGPARQEKSPSRKAAGRGRPPGNNH